MPWQKGCCFFAACPFLVSAAYISLLACDSGPLGKLSGGVKLKCYLPVWESNTDFRNKHVESPLPGCWRDPLLQAQLVCRFALLLLPAAGAECRVFGVSETHRISLDLNGFLSESSCSQEEEDIWHCLATAEFLPPVHQEVNFLYLPEVIWYVKKQWITKRSLKQLEIPFLSPLPKLDFSPEQSPGKPSYAQQWLRRSLWILFFSQAMSKQRNWGEHSISWACLLCFLGNPIVSW